MKKELLLLLILAISFKNIYAQLKVEQLHGTWESYETKKQQKEREQLTPITEPINSGKKSKETEKKEADIILQFGKKGNLDIIQFGDKSRVKFNLKDSILTMSWRKYKILKLTISELILTDPENIFSENEFYRKINKKIEPVKEIEIIEKKYKNGQLKLKGKLQNGIENGIWTEWYENGQKKSERNFINGIPIGVWKEWNKKGKLIKEKKWN